MQAKREYDAKLDSKRRITIRNAGFEYYHVQELNNGVIILEPRGLTDPFQISSNTLLMMDSAVENLKAGRESEPVELSQSITTYFAGKAVMLPFLKRHNRTRARLIIKKVLCVCRGNAVSADKQFLDSFVWNSDIS